MFMKVATSIKLEKESRDFAKKFFKRFGLTLSDGINMFLAKIVMDKKLPFELELPNKETMEAVKQVEEGEISYNDSVDDLMKELRS